MASPSEDLRRRVVEAYRAGCSGTYLATAALFGVGRASVSRWLRRARETGDIAYKPRGGNNPRRVDLDWLRGHCVAHPDARIPDRIDAWAQHSGTRASHGAMWGALHAIGWSFKKNSGRART
jgi:transposase